MPTEIGIVDLMIGFPKADARANYDSLRALAKDEESQRMEFPAEYMFKDVPNHLEDEEDPLEVTLAAMDKHGVEIGLVGLGNPATARLCSSTPIALSPASRSTPMTSAEQSARIREAHAEHGIVAVTTFPAGCNPQVPVSDRRYYPIYQTCIDLDIPIIVNAGIAGPRVPSDCQDVMHFDQVCYDFPDLRIVMRHGAEPWEDLAVKLMLKWPGLLLHDVGLRSRSTTRRRSSTTPTAGEPKRSCTPATTRWASSLDRIFSEMPNVPFRDHVWPLFLRENAMRVFKLGESIVTVGRRIPYAGSVHDEREVDAVCRVLAAGPQALRIGKNVREFESADCGSVRKTPWCHVQLRVICAVPGGRAARIWHRVTRSSPQP